MRLSTRMPLAVDRQRDELRARQASRRHGRRSGRVRRRPVDHRGGDRRRRHRSIRRLAAALHHARGDAEHAQAEVGVRSEEDARRRQHHVALAPRVLGQVLLQLELERVLVGLELAAVVRGEVDRVLVGHVDPRDRDGAVVVHLLDELACQLDRLDVRPERTAEHTLDECFDLLLDRAENAQFRGLCGFPSLAVAPGSPGLWRRLDGRRRFLHGPPPLLLGAARAGSGRIRFQRERDGRRGGHRQHGHVRLVRRRGDGDPADDEAVGGRCQRASAADERQRGRRERERGCEREHAGDRRQARRRLPGRPRAGCRWRESRARRSAPRRRRPPRRGRPGRRPPRATPAGGRQARAGAAAPVRRSRRARLRAQRAARLGERARTRPELPARRRRRGRQGRRSSCRAAAAGRQGRTRRLRARRAGSSRRQPPRVRGAIRTGRRAGRAP